MEQMKVAEVKMVGGEEEIIYLGSEGNSTCGCTLLGPGKRRGVHV